MYIWVKQNRLLKYSLIQQSHITENCSVSIAQFHTRAKECLQCKLAANEVAQHCHLDASET